MSHLRRLFILFFVGIFSSCATIQSPVLRQAFEDDLQEVRHLISSGQLKQAVEELTMLLNVSPKSEEVLSLRANVFQQLNEYDRAIIDDEKVLLINPRSAKAHYNLGMIYAYKLHDSQQALRHFDQFLSLAPSHEKSFQVVKVMCSLDIIFPEEESRAPESYYLMGQKSEQEGHTEDAIKAYRLALERRPTCASCHASLGRLLLSLNNHEEGEDHLRKARLFDPN